MDKYGITLLHIAAGSIGHKEVVKLLLAKKADVNAKAAFAIDGEIKGGMTPLHRAAAQKDNKEVVELLLASKANVNAKSNDGTTPLHIASKKDNIEVVELLLAYKADINAKKKDGTTPLHEAAEEGNKEVANLLIVNNASVNAKNDIGQTPLHTAVYAERHSKDMVAMLLANKGDINAKDKDGTTPLHEAARTGNKAVVELLLANKVDINVKEKDGTTPMKAAETKNEKVILELLRSYQAGKFQPAQLKPATTNTVPETPADLKAAPPDAETTASGLASKVLQKGTGTKHPGRTDTVTVHFSGWTADGRLFDSTLKVGSPVSLPLDKVLKGWSEGIMLMVTGEKRRLWIPPKLAYGDTPESGRPAGALVFDVELLTIEK